MNTTDTQHDETSSISASHNLDTTKIVIVGQGYVGLPVAIRAVEVGYDVVGFDLDQRKIDGLSSGKSHIDDITDADVAQALATGRYVASSTPNDISGFDIAVITVPTPLRDGAPNMSYIESASALVGEFMNPDCTVILESTTYPGTTDDLVGPLLEKNSGLVPGTDFHLGFSPERIDPGNKVWNFQRTPKVVAGIDAQSLKVVKSFYDNLVDQTVPAKGCKEAEMTKLLENTFRLVNIALVNELAVNSRKLGIDFWDVIDAAKTKPFGFMPFYPGPGVGGHCLPIDPTYLSWQFEQQLGTVSKFVKVANEINNAMPDHVVDMVQSGLNSRKKAVNGSRVLVIGLAYKKNSNDARETPATGIIDGLIALGAEVRVHDSWVGDGDLSPGATRANLDSNELTAADAVVLVTDHDDIDYDMVLENAGYIIDTRRRMTGEHVEHI